MDAELSRNWGHEKYWNNLDNLRCYRMGPLKGKSTQLTSNFEVSTVQINKISQKIRNTKTKV